MSFEDSSKKRLSWTQKYIPRPSSAGKAADIFHRPRSSNGLKWKESSPGLMTPKEGEELLLSLSPQPIAPASRPEFMAASIHRGQVAMSRSATLDATPTSRASPKRWNSPFLLTSYLKGHAENRNLERTTSLIDGQPTRSSESNRPSGSSFSKSLSSMMGGFSSLSMSRTNTRDSFDDKDRGRSMFQARRVKSASQSTREVNTSRSDSSARSQSPFSFRRIRSRPDTSPTPQPLPLGTSDVDLSDVASSILPRNAFTDDNSDDETVGENTDIETEDGSSDELFDPVTERNTERNAVIISPEASMAGMDGEEPDPLGEGVNVVLPPEPYFATLLNCSDRFGSTPGKKIPRKRKSVKHQDPLPLQTSRPLFQRDRCTITVTQGDPGAKLGDRRMRQYVVASDLSEESRYAVEWGVGTVLRDGDEMLIVTVVENDGRIDPLTPNTGDRMLKLRAQQEREGLAFILVRQVTCLLQRTRLNVQISCQAWHAKNSRHMLLDVVDYTEPTMLIVGSRGLGKLNGILLGSTSHYLIQKCSVPVMVARRRLKRPPHHSAHLSTHRTHVSLAEAGIDRVIPKADQDVKVMLNEIQKDDSRRDGGPGSRDDRRGIVEGAIGDVDDDEVGDDDADLEEDHPEQEQIDGTG